MANKTELFIQKVKTIDEFRFQDTYLAPSEYGLKLGLEFNRDVTDLLQVGQVITLDKFNKSINAWVDGTASILGFSASTIYPPPASLVFTSRDLQLPIVFSTGENGNIILDEPTIDRNWFQVDLSDTVAFPVTFNIADVRQINNRNGAYSKTVEIPGTKDNNEVFEHIFDIQAIDSYDTRVRVKCTVVVDTIPVLEGYIQLDKIKCDENNHWTYNCIIFGENANFSKEIDQNAKLEDLDFSEFTHDFNVQSVTQSWTKDWSWGYYYPLIDYNALKNPDQSSNNNTNIWLLTDFKPSIYVKQYWDKIFQNIGYTYQSQFLNSPEFENLIIPATITKVENDEAFRFCSSFKVGITQSRFLGATYAYIRGGYDQSTGFGLIAQINNGRIDTPSNLLPMTQSIVNGYDCGSQFVGPPLVKYKYTYSTNIPRRQTFVLNLDFQITPQYDTLVPTPDQNNNIQRLVMAVVIKKNGNVVANRTVVNYGINDTYPFSTLNDESINNGLDSTYGEAVAFSAASFQRQVVQVFFDANEFYFQSGDELTFEIFLRHVRRLGNQGTAPFTFNQAQQIYLGTGWNIEFFPTTTGTNGTQLYNFVDPILLENQPFSINQTIPKNIKQIDFINSIIKMFNLYLYQDKVDPKKIIIEPRSQFYFQTSLDWSEKLDISKEILQTPIVDRKKRVFLTYKEDKDYFNTLYKTTWNEIYGQYEYNTGYEFETSEQKIDVIFSPSPLAWRKVNDVTFDPAYIYTQFLQASQPTNGTSTSDLQINIRILYRKFVDIPRATEFEFRSRVGNTINLIKFDKYPYAGHLDDPFNPELDLSFYAPKQLFYLNVDFGYTDNSLYNVYYSQFFEEIYGPESKTITAYFYLTPQDILDFDYRKLIYIENISSGAPGYFRINKIEYDPFVKQSYKVELIKVLNNFDLPYNKLLNSGNTLADVKPGDISTNVKPPGGGTVIGDNNVVGGVKNVIEGNSNVVTGFDNNVKDKDSSGNIVGGTNNVVLGRNNIIVGYSSSVTSRDSAVIGGASNSVSTQRSSIIGGYNNYITYRDAGDSAIIGGNFNTIGKYPGTFSLQSERSVIIGGTNNVIESGTTQSLTENTLIIGGYNNTIAAGVTNSIIINGRNRIGTQSNTVYIDGLLLVNGATISGGGGGSQGPIGPTGPSGGDSLWRETPFSKGVGSNIELLTFTPSTPYVIGSTTRPFTGLIMASVSSISNLFPTGIQIYNGNITLGAGNLVGSDGCFNALIQAGDGAFSGGSEFSSMMSVCDTQIISSLGSSVISSSPTKTGVSIGGEEVCINNSYFSSIIASYKCSIISGSEFSSIISSCAGCIEINSSRSSIISSANGTIKPHIIGSDSSSIISHAGGRINSSFYSSIIGGCDNNLCDSKGSVIMGSYTSYIGISQNNVILGGQFNEAQCNNNSAIIGGGTNKICGYSDSSNIMTSCATKIYDTIFGSIIGGLCSCIEYSYQSAIIGGYYNCITNSTRSIILGGSYQTLNAVSDAVLISHLIVSNSISPDSGVSLGINGTYLVSGSTFSFCNGILVDLIQ